LIQTFAGLSIGLHFLCQASGFRFQTGSLLLQCGNPKVGFGVRSLQLRSCLHGSFVLALQLRHGRLRWWYLLSNNYIGSDVIPSGTT
jgi:hypothetical protein